MYNWKQNLSAVLLLFFSVLVDGFIASAWTAALETSFGLIVPRTVILILVLLAFHYNDKFVLGSAAIFGFIMDTYYLGFIGVYMSSLVLIAYLVYQLRQLLPSSVLSYTLVSILAMTVVELVVYSIVRILGLSSISFQLFLVTRLSATLLFNGMIMLVFSHFLHQLIINIMGET